MRIINSKIIIILFSIMLFSCTNCTTSGTSHSDIAPIMLQFSVNNYFGIIHDNTIEVLIPFDENQNYMKCSFTVEKGIIVIANNMQQKSGDCALDFTKPIIFMLKNPKNNLTTSYTVNVQKTKKTNFKNIVYVFETNSLNNAIKDGSIFNATHIILFDIKLTQEGTNTYAWHGDPDSKYVVTQDNKDDAILTSEMQNNIKLLHNNHIQVLVSFILHQNQITAITPKNWDTLANNLYTFIQDNNLDGVDIDFSPGEQSKSNVNDINIVIAAFAKYIKNNKKQLSFSTPYWQATNSETMSFFDYSSNKDILDKLDWINVDNFDFNQENLTINKFISHEYSELTNEFKFPKEKLILGFANAGNDDSHGFSLPANRLIQTDILPIYSDEFAGVSSWELGGDKYYGHSWINEINAFFRGNLPINPNVTFTISYKKNIPQYVYIPSTANNNYGLYKRTGLITWQQENIKLVDPTESKLIAITNQNELFFVNKNDHSITYWNQINSPKTIKFTNLFNHSQQNYDNPITKIYFMTQADNNVYIYSDQGIAFSNNINRSTQDITFTLLQNTKPVGVIPIGLVNNNKNIFFANNEKIYMYNKNKNLIQSFQENLPQNMQFTVFENYGNCLYVKGISSANNYYKISSSQNPHSVINKEFFYINYFNNDNLTKWIEFDAGRYTNYCKINLQD